MAKKKADIHPFDRLLKDLKKEEFDVNSTITLSDIDIRLIAVWPRVERVVLGSPYDNDRVPEAWNYIDFYAEEWARLAQVDVDVVWNRWIGLSVNKLIYPDGTCHGRVQTILLMRADELVKLR